MRKSLPRRELHLILQGPEIGNFSPSVRFDKMTSSDDAFTVNDDEQVIALDGHA